MPYLEIPTFSGEKAKFQAFLDEFDSLIGNKNYISKVDKLAYLLRYTKNNVLKLIESLPVTENNYEVARNILIKTYLDIVEIKNDLALQLIKLPKCKGFYKDIFKF